MRTLRIALAAALAAACGPDLDFRQARHLEDAGEHVRAVKAYERFITRRAGDPRLPEALYRAGRLYGSSLGRCPEASELLERAARMPPAQAGPWAERARLALMDCPDFFPLRHGARWTYVDSASGGKNMRLDVRAEVESSTSPARLSGAYFAGGKRFRAYRREAGKDGWDIWESDGAARLPVLSYPFRAGRSWTASDGGRAVAFSIEQDAAEVRTRAGTFSGCLKVKRHAQGDPSWVYDYYCPGVGRAKTTIGAPGVENPNTELSAYQPLR